MGSFLDPISDPILVHFRGRNPGFDPIWTILKARNPRFGGQDPQNDPILTPFWTHLGVHMAKLGSKLGVLGG